MHNFVQFSVPSLWEHYSNSKPDNEGNLAFVYAEDGFWGVVLDQCKALTTVC